MIASSIGGFYNRPTVEYVATITPVRELILAGTADLAYWRARLAPLGLLPHDEGGRAAIALSAIAGRFRGLPFREFSVGVVAGEEGGEDSVYLVGAFNSSRLMAWAERTFFRTPYEPAEIRLNETPPAGFTVSAAGQVVCAATMVAAAPPLRHESHDWRGRIYLPPRGPRRELFYARLAGPTTIYPFTAADTLTIRPHPGDDVLGCLVESGFAGREWRARAAAVHERSRTYRL